MMSCDNNGVNGTDERPEFKVDMKRNEKIDPILRKLVNGLAPHLNEEQVRRVCK